MVKQLRAALYSSMFLAILGLIGCSSPAVTKPAVTAPLAQVPQAAVKPGKEIQRAQAPTSLEALRRSEAPTTPKESPLKEVYFDFDKYDLRPDARATLKANADWLKRNAGVRAEIEGHADERGTNEYNLALGVKRSQAVRDYLVTLGVEAGRLSTISYGEEVLVCKEKTEECWQRNRRARFVARAEKPGV